MICPPASYDHGNTHVHTFVDSASFHSLRRLTSLTRLADQLEHSGRMYCRMQLVFFCVNILTPIQTLPDRIAQSPATWRSTAAPPPGCGWTLIIMEISPGRYPCQGKSRRKGMAMKGEIVKRRNWQQQQQQGVATSHVSIGRLCRRACGLQGMATTAWPIPSRPKAPAEQRLRSPFHTGRALS